jgi:hypothetical protein
MRHYTMDAVFDKAICSVVGPPDGSITTAERAHLLAVRNVMLRIVVDRTVANLPEESRVALARSVIAAAGRHVVIGEWGLQA